MDSGGRSYGRSVSSPISTIRPAKPSARSVSAALAPASDAPTMTNVRSSAHDAQPTHPPSTAQCQPWSHEPARARRARPASVRRGHLVDDHPQPGGVVGRGPPQRREHRVERRRAARPTSASTSSRSTPAPGRTARREPGPAHHVPQRDALEQRALGPRAGAARPGRRRSGAAAPSPYAARVAVTAAAANRPVRTLVGPLERDQRGGGCRRSRRAARSTGSASRSIEHAPPGRPADSAE